MIKLLFGKAGSGKSFIGRLSADRYGFHFHDADADLPSEMKRAVLRHENISEAMRDALTQTIIHRIASLKERHDRLCVSQALFRNKHRARILEAFPSLEFVWVDSPDAVILERLRHRADHMATRYYAEKINREFEEPAIPHGKIVNGWDPAAFQVQLDSVFTGSAMKGKVSR